MPSSFSFFFFNDTATTEIYTLSLHDALPIWLDLRGPEDYPGFFVKRSRTWRKPDRKSTRLNSSHLVISYAVFCLKKKKTTRFQTSCALSRAHDPRCPFASQPEYNLTHPAYHT